MKVFITREIPGTASDLLKSKNIKVKTYKGDKPIPYKLLKKEVKEVEGIISLLTDKIDEEMIDSMNRCKVIANYAVGYNNINVPYADSKGIIVTNTPDVLTDSTADLAFALILACSRRVIEGEEIMRKKKFKGWQPKLLLGIELKGKNFGIIGTGRIGTAVAKRAAGFGVKILYYDNKENTLINSLGVKKVGLDILLKNSDIITLHLPLNEMTFHLLDKKRLQLLKRTAVFINTARGELVEENELINMLKRGRIFSAGFDVYENEPHINPELYKLRNVVLLPHLGSATEDSRGNMARLAAENVIAVLKGNSPITPVPASHLNLQK
ncbi:MAG TPA: D-glycerate dehydrogenase [Ignavibacteriaceae bacterium]